VNAEASEREALFWESAEDSCADPAVTRSTMMGFPCLRINGGFFARVEPGTGYLIVKLPAHRVTESVNPDIGIRFALGRCGNGEGTRGEQYRGRRRQASNAPGRPLK